LYKLIIFNISSYANYFGYGFNKHQQASKISFAMALTKTVDS